MVPSFYNKEIETQEVDLTTADVLNSKRVRVRIQISELSESPNCQFNSTRKNSLENHKLLERKAISCP